MRCAGRSRCQGVSHLSSVSLLSRCASAGFVGFVEQEQAIGGHGWSVFDATIGEHGVPVGPAGLTYLHALLLGRAIRCAFSQVAGKPHVEPLSRVAVGLIEVPKAAQRSRVQIGLLSKLCAREDLRVDIRLVLPRTLQELAEAATDRIAELLDNPKPTVIGTGTINAKSGFSTTPKIPSLPSARRTSSSRTRIQRFS